MKRREFISLLGGACVMPVKAFAQQQAVPVIGFLGQSTPAAESPRADAFVRRLEELGWMHGRTVVIRYGWGEGRAEKFEEIAAEFVRLNVSVIVTSGTANVAAAKKATTRIPIVFAVAGDPVGNKLVESLARPGGNVTGLSTLAVDLAGKRIELLRETVPNITRVAVLGNADNSLAIMEMQHVKEAASNLGIAVIDLMIRRANEIAPAFESHKGRAEALYVVADPLTNTSGAEIRQHALSAGLPTIFNAREHVEAGGLLSYGPNFRDLYRRAADFVDKILRGTKPSDLPVEQPSKLEMVINLRTAKALGLTVPATLLARADEVIE